MTWEAKDTSIIRLGLQDKFEITYYQLDFFSKEFQSGLDNVDCEKDSKYFAKCLFNVISDHLSRRNLRDIINECSRRLERWDDVGEF